MDDLVKRLRDAGSPEAAKEIERLREVLKELSSAVTGADNWLFARTSPEHSDEIPEFEKLLEAQNKADAVLKQ